MVELGGVMTIVQQGNTVLLTKREDFEVWCLPGGGVDDRERPEQAAIREVREETGIEVQITRLIAIIARPHWGPKGRISLVFAAVPVGGQLRPDPHEVTELGYIPHDALPEAMLYGHATMIQAAFRGAIGQVWLANDQRPAELANRAQLYAWRDQTGLSRVEAYQLLLTQYMYEPMHCVVPGS